MSLNEYIFTCETLVKLSIEDLVGVELTLYSWVIPNV